VTAPPAFPVVAIGASAGGIEALEGFFRGLPAHPGAAFVVLTHLRPGRESILHEIVTRYTSLTVRVAADGMRVAPDCVYVLPADAVLGIGDGALRMQVRTRPERKPIDIFFSELAVDRGELAVGVVLSGGDGDGALGVKAIKAHGGLTLAQVGDAYGPQYPDMPQSAIATGLVDFALPVDQMGGRIVDFVRSAHLLDAAGADAAAEQRLLGEARPELCTILRNQTGHDFSGYKARTFTRRVQRRMQVQQLGTVEAYVARLRQEPEEVTALFRDLLINVTNFFRDTDAFAALASSVIPALFAGRGAADTVRVWIPGCSTGEEVFSVGMLLREHMDRLGEVPRVQIFATDIDDRALAVARAARYPAPMLDGVPPQRRERFFQPDGGAFVVAKEVRDLCIFSPHSVIRDPPFSRIDLVSCRNLLIYFGARVQRQVIPVFYYALRPDGYLFLGTAENVGPFDDLFVALDSRQRIFRRRSDVVANVRLPAMLGSLRAGYTAPADLALRRPLAGGSALRQAAESQILERFAPPHVVVSRDGDVVYYAPRTGKYLEAAAGAPTRQLLAMARKGLRLELQTTFRDAVETGRAVTRSDIPVEDADGRVQMITLTIEPLRGAAAGEPLFLVVFADQGPTLSREAALGAGHAAGDGEAGRLEQELRDTRERLQAMIEEYETALEELKSSNEELMSVNEEFQSTNEELESSKEELQSVNEELQTVNADLQAKIESLDRASSDLRNLIDSTDVAIVFLDRDLLVRSFTPAVTTVFSLLPGDRGRPITDIASRFDLPGFTADIADVFAGGGPRERRVEDRASGAHYLVRLLSYRDSNRTTDGVVVSFVEITGLVRAQNRQRVLIAELQHRARNLLAVVHAIASQTLGNDPALAAFTTRLAALGRVQDLVGHTTTGEVELDQLVREEIAAVCGSADQRVTIAGPPVGLDLERIQTLALALHELATNAVKYGALSTPGGRLDVLWTIGRDGAAPPFLVLDWQEHGVALPPVAPPTGYGRELIERALVFTLRARTALSFGPDGVSCRIEIPLLSGPPAGPDGGAAEPRS
jgi:two-component system, chemotaxis family, CheB/CheR fusion protein